jgi:uncharacterized protein (TIGR03118 family)
MKIFTDLINHRLLILAVSGFALVFGLLSFPASVNAGPFLQSNLVSDISGLAAYTDPNLKNPWGISSSPTSPFWISDNKTGLATIYNGSGQATPLVVTIAPASGGSTATPTGQVFNGGSGFGATRFIFATEDGTISGWSSGTSSILKVDNSTSGAVYKGLAIGNNGVGDFLYAANFFTGTIDVFSSSFAPTTLTGSFTDPTIPSGFAPFNIQNFNGNLLVTYALQDGAKHDDVAGPGNGFIDVFDLNGNLQKRLISNGALNSPWGLALAPGNFGDFSNDLLVGNFGDGKINAFDPTSGAFLGTMADNNGISIVNEGLWGLKFGNGGNGGATDTLYFTAGIRGNDNVEDHGLFGSLKPVPEPTTMLLLGLGLIGLAGMRRKMHK